MQELKRVSTQFLPLLLLFIVEDDNDRVFSLTVSGVGVGVGVRPLN